MPATNNFSVSTISVKLPLNEFVSDGRATSGKLKTAAEPCKQANNYKDANKRLM
jgi:hypothetical protein